MQVAVQKKRPNGAVSSATETAASTVHFGGKGKGKGMGNVKDKGKGHGDHQPRCSMGTTRWIRCPMPVAAWHLGC
jgi:hypothetical protein